MPDRLILVTWKVRGADKRPRSTGRPCWRAIL